MEILDSWSPLIETFGFTDVPSESLQTWHRSSNSLRRRISQRITAATLKRPTVSYIAVLALVLLCS